MKGARLVVFMWFVAVAIIVWRWAKQAGTAPPASAFVGTGIVYPTAAIITAFPSPAAQFLGGTLAVGWTLSILYAAAGVGQTQQQTQGQDQAQGSGKEDQQAQGQDVPGRGKTKAGGGK